MCLVENEDIVGAAPHRSNNNLLPTKALFIVDFDGSLLDCCGPCLLYVDIVSGVCLEMVENSATYA